MVTVFIDSHNPYPPPYSTKYRVMKDVNTQLSPDFAVYNDAAAWASANGYCLISGSMGWNVGGNPPCPVTAPSSSPTVSPIVTIGQCEGTPDGVYTFGTCKNGQLVTGYAAPAEQYYVPPSSQPPATTTTTTTPPPPPPATTTTTDTTISKPPPAPYPVEEIAPPTNVWQQDATCPSGFRDYLTGACKPFTPLPGNEFGYGTSSVTVTIKSLGNGIVKSSGGDNTLAVRNSIVVPSGYKVYFQAIPSEGESFLKWTSSEGVESTANSLEVQALHDGDITANFTGKSGNNTGLYIIGAIALGVVALLFGGKK